MRRIRLSDLELRGHSGAVLLSGINTSVATGETLSVVGAGGTGKTSLVKCIVLAALERPDSRRSGSIEFGFSNSRPGRMGVVFDDPLWAFCNLRVDEEVAFVLENSGIPSSEVKSRVSIALSEVGLAGFESRRITTLSGGELRRLALAAALVSRPDLLISDDLDASLDSEAIEQFKVLLSERVRNDGLSWIDFVRRPQIFTDRRDRVAILLDRRLEELELWDAAGKAINCLERSVGLPVEVELMTHLFPGSMPDALIRAWAGFPNVIVDALKVGGKRILSRVDSTPLPSPIVFSAEDLSFRFSPDRQLLHHCTFQIQGGQIQVLSGKNGSGKSTLARIIAGLMQAHSGSMYLDSRPARTSALLEACFLVFQCPEYQFVSDTVESEVHAACREWRALDKEETVNSILTELELVDKRHLHPFALSLGERRRLAVGLALVSNRRILIVDEPTLGQDYRQTRQLGKLLRGVAQRGTAVLVITHDANFTYDFADSVLVLRDGKIDTRTAPTHRSNFIENNIEGVPGLLRFWFAAEEAGITIGNPPRSYEDLCVR